MRIPLVPRKVEAPSDSAREMEAWAKRPPKRARAKTIPDAQWKRAREEALAMLKSGEWKEATPRHFAAAYALLHERVYGVEPGDLTPTTRLMAAGLAARMLDKEFDADKGALAGFLLWTWKREEGREKWRRENGREGGRITPRLQFNGAIVTDFRLEMERKSRKVAAR